MNARHREVTAVSDPQELSTEAVEQLVQEFAEYIESDAMRWSAVQTRAYIREFAERVRGERR
jgi:hypothetical protein